MLSFLAVTLVLFGVISIMANALLDRQFQQYVMGQQEKDNQAIAQILGQSYGDWDSEWDATGIETLGVNALESGLMLRISDKDGTVLWDAMVHNSGKCARILADMASMMESHYNDFNGGYEEKAYDIVSDGKNVGTVVVGYYGPYFYTENDMRFLTTLNRLLLGGGAAALLLALGLGLWLAAQLATPIKDVTKAARQISEGNLEERIHRKTNTTEIAELAGAVNSLAESLQKQESLRKQLTADVAHELRTPLATLQSHLEAMIDGVWEADKERLALIHDEAARLSKLVRSLEELTQYDKDNIKLNLAPVDLAALLRRVAKTFEAEARTKGIWLETAGLELPASGPAGTVTGDWDKLTQAFINLVSNAVKYTPEGGRISLSLEAGESGFWAVVSDTGSGIPAEDLPFIFERFFRADPSRNKHTGGTGIGLAIVQSIVRAHRGQVWVTSEPGKGSAFRVFLPR
jgi:signal transduction histidine kinase